MQDNVHFYRRCPGAKHHQVMSQLNALRLLMAGLALAVLLPLHAADNEELILTVEGDLISRLDTLAEDAAPTAVIAAYYALLPAEERIQGEALDRRLRELVPDYQVAYGAADSAEITQVRSYIYDAWVGIQSLHARYFQSEVVQILKAAYQERYATILKSDE